MDEFTQDFLKENDLGVYISAFKGKQTCLQKFFLIVFPLFKTI